MSLLVQCQVRSGDRLMTTWLDTHKPIEVGNRITLKGETPSRLWTVETIGQPTESNKIHRCPCCNRTFVNLGRHMAGQHPDFTKDGE